MSNPYRNTPGVRYFQMPQAIVPALSYVAPADLKLLCYVQAEAQLTSKVTMELPGIAVAQATGIHPTCIGEARKNLMRMGLLLAERRGRAWFYSLCDPNTRMPLSDSEERLRPLDFDTLPPRVLEQYFRPLLRRCRPSDDGLTGCCPFPTHSDQSPSFTVSLEEGSGGVWQCRGCSRSGKLVEFEMYRSEEIGGLVIDATAAHRRVLDRLHTLGVRESTTGQYDIVYGYEDEFGELNSETVRLGGDKKRTIRRRPHPEHPHLRIKNTKGCKHLLYRLPEIMEADTVVVVEGEPDVEAIRSLRLVDDAALLLAATTCPLGAGAWKSAYTMQLRGKTVILIGHNDVDGKGQRHMDAVEKSLSGQAVRVIRRTLPNACKDVDEYLSQHTAEDFIELIGEELVEIAHCI